MSVISDVALRLTDAIKCYWQSRWVKITAWKQNLIPATHTNLWQEADGPPSQLEALHAALEAAGGARHGLQEAAEAARVGVAADKGRAAEVEGVEAAPSLADHLLVVVELQDAVPVQESLICERLIINSER